MARAGPESSRLHYLPLSADRVESFHRLAVDPHIKRYLLDGQTVTREWCCAEVERSRRLFEERGVGLWLIWEAREDDPANTSGAPIGFAGFRVFEELGPEIQLIYAFVASATGRGYATEAGLALLEFASRPLGPGCDGLLAGVDAPNRASIRVLEKLDFAPVDSVPGDFGTILLFRRRVPRPLADPP